MTEQRSVIDGRIDPLLFAVLGLFQVEEADGGRIVQLNLHFVVRAIDLRLHAGK